jgi:hypothetical protein
MSRFNMKFVRNTETNEIFAVGDDDFEPTMFCDIYDNRGNQIDHADSGAYIVLLTKKAVAYMRHADKKYKLWSIGDPVYAYDYPDIFWQFYTGEDFEHGVDYEIECETIEAITLAYNNKYISVAINSELYATDYEWVDDELSAQLLEQSSEYEFHKSDGNGNWWEYKIIKKDLPMYR